MKDKNRHTFMTLTMYVVPIRQTKRIISSSSSSVFLVMKTNESREGFLLCTSATTVYESLSEKIVRIAER